MSLESQKRISLSLNSASEFRSFLTAIIITSMFCVVLCVVLEILCVGFDVLCVVFAIFCVVLVFLKHEFAENTRQG